jgi:SAM-dependent MidA family methyltransferase
MNVPNDLKDLLISKKKISFSDFMHHALYNQNSGYYTTKANIFGKLGDFTTAPEISELFGQCVAECVYSVLRDLNSAVVLEFGAGSGILAAEILQSLVKKTSLPIKYYILEVSASLRKVQYETIKDYNPELLQYCEWLNALPQKPFNGVIIANEVLDAMPCERIMKHDNKLFQSYINLNKDSLEEVFLPCAEPFLLEYGSHLPNNNMQYVTEVNCWAKPWLASLNELLEAGGVLLIDYGFVRREYLHIDRYMGTLMCHYKHQSHTNPLINIGMQDITAHVEFTLIAEVADLLGFKIAGFTSQAAFLLECGILEKLNCISDVKQKISTTQAVKVLLQPHEMGELFKVMLLTKNISHPILGFNLQDKRTSL